ncbi:MAG: family efflux transporter, partial [Akkermansiaceae bacterium]|nr:family efflux transporter [Akkermansiaceae bacterium]
KGPAWIAFGAYWVVSIPLGWALAFPGGWGVNGMWWGITAGLTLTSLALGQRIWRRIRGLIEQNGELPESAAATRADS